MLQKIFHNILIVSLFLFSSCNRPIDKPDLPDHKSDQNISFSAQPDAQDSLVLAKLWTDKQFRDNRTRQFRSLDDAFKNPDSVVNLAVYSGFAGVIPQNIDTFRNVQLIGANNNNLVSLPESMARLKYLQIIHLNKNHFEEFPLVLTQNRYLKTVLISDNRITSLPEEISRLIFLENLVLNDNRLGKVPEALFGLPNLRVLGLRENGIKELPDQFSRLPGLEKLNLQNNGIRVVPESLITHPSLQRITLKGNPMTEAYISSLRMKMPGIEIEF